MRTMIDQISTTFRRCAIISGQLTCIRSQDIHVCMNKWKLLVKLAVGHASLCLYKGH